MTESRVERWINSYDNKNTRKNYRRAVILFFEAKNFEELIEKSEQYLDDCISGKITIENIQEDIHTFLKRLLEVKNTPRTRWIRLTGTRVFLSEYGIILGGSFWKKLKRRQFKGRVDPVHEDYIPSNVEIRRVISHMPIHGQALYRLMATCGSRIGETLQLRLQDVDLHSKQLAPHVIFRAETTKAGVKRTGFMTPETKADIEEWLSKRNDYIIRAVGRSRWREHYGVSEDEWGGKSVTDNRLFPFKASTAYSIWTTAIKKAKLAMRDEHTNKYALRPHCLRKWFRTRLGSVMKLDVVEALMGHEGYLTRAYRRYSNKELSNKYLEHQEVLLLDVEYSVDRLNGKIREQEKQLQVVTISQATRIAELEQTQKALLERLASFEEAVEDYMPEYRKAFAERKKKKRK
jgi:integrase